MTLFLCSVLVVNTWTTLTSFFRYPFCFTIRICFSFFFFFGAAFSNTFRRSFWSMAFCIGHHHPFEFIQNIGYQFSSIQFSSVPWSLGSSGDMRNYDSADIFSQSFLREAIVSSSDMGRDVHSLTWAGISTLWHGQGCPLSDMGRDFHSLTWAGISTLWHGQGCPLSDMGRDVHSLTLSFQHFLCRQRRRPLCKMPWRMVLERLSWCMTHPKHASFCLLTIARRDLCGLTWKLILFRSAMH